MVNCKGNDKELEGLLKTITYLMIVGKVLVGDMMLNEDQYRAITAKSNNEAIFHNAIENLDLRWSDNEMPVEIDESTIFEAYTVLILETLSELNSDLCGCFRIR